MIATTVQEQIKSSFDALNLILVFVSVIFGVKYSDIRAALKSDIPDAARRIDRANHRRGLLNNLLTSCLPLFVVTGAAWFLFLPLFIHIAGDEPFHPWNRDITDNAFLFIAGMTGVFFAWSLYLLPRMLAKIGRSWWGGRQHTA